MKPLLNRVAVRPDSIQKVTDGGVHLPDTVDQTSNEGTVVAVGPGLWNDRGERIPMSVKAGDRVLMDSRRAPSVTLGDQIYLIVPETQLALIFEEGESPAPDLASTHPKNGKPRHLRIANTNPEDDNE